MAYLVQSTTVDVERKAGINQILSGLQVIFCNSWVSAGKPLSELFLNLMSGHLSWVSHWPSPAFSASDWLMEGELISGDSIMSAINCSPLLASQTPWRTTGVVRKPHSLFKVLIQTTREYQTLCHLFKSDWVCYLVLKWMSWKLILYKIWLRYDSFKVTTRNESSKSEWGYLSAHVSVEYNLLSWPC